MKAGLSAFVFWLQNARAIRREAVSLYLEHGIQAVAIARKFARAQSGSSVQRQFYQQVHWRLQRLVLDMQDLDTATRYLAHERLQKEYSRGPDAGSTRASITRVLPRGQNSGSAVE
jgi:hypothetical protein